MPKALVEIGGRPILWHVIEIYAAQGFDRFLLCTGYLGEMIEEFVGGGAMARGGRGRVRRHRPRHADRRPDQAARGPARRRRRSASPTPTASPTSTSAALLDFHRGHGELATVTVVRPQLQWGVAELDGDGRVEGFVEKPRTEHWVNGGFFCFEPGALDYLDADSVLEREPLERLAADGPAAGLPPRGLLGLHGHLQGRGRPQRPLGGRRGALETSGAGRGERCEAVAGHRRATASSPRTWRGPCSSAATR